MDSAEPGGALDSNSGPDVDLTAAATSMDEAVAAETLPRWYGRLPWKQIAIAAGLAAFWLAIGLVCSPRYFRF